MNNKQIKQNKRRKERNKERKKRNKTLDTLDWVTAHARTVLIATNNPLVGKYYYSLIEVRNQITRQCTSCGSCCSYLRGALHAGSGPRNDDALRASSDLELAGGGCRGAQHLCGTPSLSCMGKKEIKKGVTPLLTARLYTRQVKFLYPFSIAPDTEDGHHGKVMLR